MQFGSKVLLGGFVSQLSSSVIFLAPSTWYERFVNASIVRRRRELGDGFTNDVLKKNAAAEWHGENQAARSGSSLLHNAEMYVYVCDPTLS